MTEKKTNLFESYETDTVAEEEGAWVELRPGIHVRIRSSSSSTVREYATKLAKNQRNIMKANGWVLPPKMSDRNDVLLCKHAIVTDWNGVTDREGNDVPYSPENVEKILIMLPRFREDIMFASQTDETYKATREDMLGNSERPSKVSSSSGDEATTSSLQHSSAE